MAVIGEAVIEVKPDSKGFGPETEKTVLSQVKGIAAKAAVIMGGAFVVRGAVNLFGDALAEAEDARKTLALTEAVITSTGGAAGVTAEQMGDLAGRLSNLSAVDDEVIQSANNVLLTFTNVKNGVGEGNDVFDQAAEAALNMSAALGTDLQGSTLQLGKALNDPIKGMTALSRAGVSFTADQKAQVKAMVAAGDTLGAQKLILAELNKEFAGAAEAAAAPLDRLKVTVGNLKESLGTALAPGFVAALGGIGDAVQGLEPAMTSLGKVVGQTIGDLAPVIVDSIGPVVETLSGVLGTVVSAIGPALEAVGGALAETFSTIGPALVDTIGPIARTLADVFATIGPPIIGAIGNIVEQLGPVLGDIVGILGEVFTSGIGPVIQALGPVVREVATTLGQALGPVLQQLGPILGQVAGQLGTAFASLAPVLGQVATLLAQGLGQALVAIVPAFGNLLAAIVPIVTTLITALAPVLPKIAELVGGLAAALGGILGDVLVSLTPLFETIADVLVDLAPVLADLAELVVDVLGDALEAILPLIADLAAGLGGRLSEVVATLAPVFVDLVDALMPLVEGVLDALAPLLPIITSALGSVLDAAMPLVGVFFDLAAPLIDLLVPILEAVAPLLEVLAELLAGALGAAIGVVVPLIEGLVSVLSSVIGFVTDVFSGNWSKAWDGIKRAFSVVWDAITGAIDGIVDFVGGLPGRIADAASGMWDSLKEGLLSVVNAIIGIWNKLDFALGPWSIPDWVPLVGGKKFEIKDIFPDIPLITLASGAVVGSASPAVGASAGTLSQFTGLTVGHPGHDRTTNKATLAVLGEAGPEVVLPLSNRKRMIELLFEALGLRRPSAGGRHSDLFGGIPAFANGGIVGGSVPQGGDPVASQQAWLRLVKALLDAAGVPPSALTADGLAPDTVTRFDRVLEVARFVRAPITEGPDGSAQVGLAPFVSTAGLTRKALGGGNGAAFTLTVLAPPDAVAADNSAPFFARSFPGFQAGQLAMLAQRPEQAELQALGLFMRALDAIGAKSSIVDLEVTDYGIVGKTVEAHREAFAALNQITGAAVRLNEDDLSGAAVLPGNVIVTLDSLDSVGNARRVPESADRIDERVAEAQRAWSFLTSKGVIDSSLSASQIGAANVADVIQLLPYWVRLAIRAAGLMPATWTADQKAAVDLPAFLSRIPQLADGGIVQPRSGGTLALLAERGQAEAVLPLSQLDRLAPRQATNTTVDRSTVVTVERLDVRASEPEQVPSAFVRELDLAVWQAG